MSTWKWRQRRFKHISGLTSAVPDCNWWCDNNLIVLSHWNTTTLAQSYDIPPGHIIMETGQPVFALNYCLYNVCRAWLPIWNAWFVSAGNRTRDLPDTVRILYHDANVLVEDKSYYVLHNLAKPMETQSNTLFIFVFRRLRSMCTF